jgi:hypothetical protein
MKAKRGILLLWTTYIAAQTTIMEAKDPSQPDEIPITKRRSRKPSMKILSSCRASPAKTLLKRIPKAARGTIETRIVRGCRTPGPARNGKLSQALKRVLPTNSNLR